MSEQLKLPGVRPAGLEEINTFLQKARAGRMLKATAEPKAWFGIVKRVRYDRQGTWTPEYGETIKFVEASVLDQALKMLWEAKDTLEFVTKGCPTNYPGCTCVRDSAYITLEKMGSICQKESGY